MSHEQRDKKWGFSYMTAGSNPSSELLLYSRDVLEAQQKNQGMLSIAPR